MPHPPAKPDRDVARPLGAGDWCVWDTRRNEPRVRDRAVGEGPSQGSGATAEPSLSTSARIEGRAGGGQPSALTDTGPQNIAPICRVPDSADRLSKHSPYVRKPNFCERAPDACATSPGPPGRRYPTVADNGRRARGTGRRVGESVPAQRRQQLGPCPPPPAWVCVSPTSFSPPASTFELRQDGAGLGI
jgi:hypothetical protein